MALTLTVRSGQAVPKITFESPKVVLGRGSGCELVLPDPSVSHRHASIRQRGSDYIVLDEGSTNGTCVGPVRLSEGTPRVLKSGDLLRLGRVWLEVTIEQAPPSPNAKDLTREIALQLIEGALAAEGEPHAHPKVTVTKGPSKDKTLTLDRFNAPYVVGRGVNCDLHLEDDDCSRRHVELRRRGGRIIVQDLGSKNGAALEGERIGSKASVAWQPGEVLRLGQSELALEDPVSLTLSELEAAPDELVEGSVDPPQVVAQQEASDGGAHALPEAKKEAKIAELPKARRTRRQASERSNWGLADTVIVLLSLLVLALSLGGLAWLLSS